MRESIGADLRPNRIVVRFNRFLQGTVEGYRELADPHTGGVQGGIVLCGRSSIRLLTDHTT